MPNVYFLLLINFLLEMSFFQLYPRELYNSSYPSLIPLGEKVSWCSPHWLSIPPSLPYTPSDVFQSWATTCIYPVLIAALCSASYPNKHINLLKGENESEACQLLICPLLFIPLHFSRFLSLPIAEIDLQSSKNKIQ